MHGDTKFDVLIVGSGPASLAFWHRLKGLGPHRIGIIESGDVKDDNRYSELNYGLSTGKRHIDLRGSQRRAFGRGSKLWAGHCRKPDKTAFQDFYVGRSTWPIKYSDMNDYFKATDEFLNIDRSQVPNNFYNDEPIDLLRDLQRQSNSLQLNYFHELSRKNRDIGGRLLDDIKKCPKTTLLLGRTVIRLSYNRAGTHVTGVHTRRLDGNDESFHARVIILAGGAIQNVKILQSSPHPSADRQNTWVGHGFMTHRGFIGMAMLRVANPRCGSSAPTDSSKPIDRNIHRVGMEVFPSLSNAITLRNNVSLRKISAPNQYAELVDTLEIRHVIDQLRLIKQRLVDQRLCRQVDKSNIGSFYMVNLGMEQPSLKDNKCVLGSEKDVLGTPNMTIHLEDYSDYEIYNCERILATFATVISKPGNYELYIPEKTRARTVYQQQDPVNHLIGTTRMGETPKSSVVDQNCKRWGTDNLFVAGSSVFPISSICNPTYMIIAMSIRLADHCHLLLKRMDSASKF